MEKIIFIVLLLISLSANVKVFLLDKYIFVGEQVKREGSDSCNDVALARKRI